ncbi:MAG: signal peptidase I [candidate division Zixibacteria bacterium]|nr:signal peptidase I [candidate division Zixibacteria bacterium]
MADRKRQAFVKEYVEAILIAIVIAVILRMFVVQAYRVSSGSMESTLQEGDFLFVNKFTYIFSEPKLGDIIVFEYPLNPAKDFIKRIVALPGQKVEIRDKRFYVDDILVTGTPGVIHTDSGIIPELFSSRDNFGPYQVPAGQYFVMGDNRDDSRDSRFWGSLERKYIKGKVLFIYWSWAPDPNAPTIGPPIYIDGLISSIFYNITHLGSRLRLGRIFKTV